jgi:ParB family chromosome partitioning protein
MRQTVLTLAPQPAPSELVMMPLSLIVTRAQVRTEFNDETLAELAGDIAARGVLQPILLRPNPGMLNYLVIAGERRFRAAQLAQLENIPAIVGEIDDDAAAAMQIAENIQREDLNLADTAAAVRKLYELNDNSVTTTAEKLHKSKSWVSKRLAASCPDLRLLARGILEKGFSEDLEIILILDKLQAMDYYACLQLCEQIQNGNAGRQTVRDAYEKAKKDNAEREQRKAEYSKQYDSPEEIEKRQQLEDAWKATNAAEKERERLNPMRLRYMCNDELDDDQKAMLETHLKALHSSGQNNYGNEVIRTVIRMHNGDYTNIEIAAFVAGTLEIIFDLDGLIKTTIDSEQEEND